MNEGKNKRDWIKNVAIIFLTIMLLLTFFSQTIMNYSLPEVAVQYVESGSITAKIRGTGTIESGDPYYVTIEQQRKVEAVNVRPGDVVQEGDVLAILSEKQTTDMDAKEQEVEAAKEAAEVAQKDLDSYLLDGTMDVSIINSDGNIGSTTKLKNKIVDLKKQEAAYDKEIEDLKKESSKIGVTINDFTMQLAATSINNVGTDQERANYNNAVKAYNDAEAAFAQVKVEKENYLLQHPEVGGMDISTVTPGDAYAVLLEKYMDAEKLVNTTQSTKEQAYQVLENRLEQTKASLDNQQNAWELQKYSVDKSITAKEEEKALVTKALEELLVNIDAASMLRDKLDAVDKAQEKYQELLASYEELQHVSVDTEVVAPFNGTIVSVPISAGTDTIDSPGEGKGYTIVTMQREGKGYTMQFSVTNEQANKIKVGDAAEVVNSWRYDNMSLTVTGIKNDLKNPGQGKVVTLDVKGDYITPGQSISVSVGEKSANYEMIVPNSAIREDNNGKFVLMVETKPSPLGNRYIATRVDVKVIASDDTKSAISGDLYAWSYVITTATAPVEAGQMVRLADN